MRAASPCDRGGHAVDAASGQLALMHGGWGHGVGSRQGNLADLWTLALSETGMQAQASTDPSWQPLAASGTPPSARAGHSLTALRCNRTPLQDAAAMSCVLFGGFGERALDDVHVLTVGAPGTAPGAAPGNAPNTALSASSHAEREQSWASWSQPRVLGTPPGPRCAHAAIATPDGRGVLVFGGYTPTGPDGTLWLLELLEGGAQGGAEDDAGDGAERGAKEGGDCGADGAKDGGVGLAWTRLYAAAPSGQEGPCVELPRSGHTMSLTSHNRLIVCGGLDADHSVLDDLLGLDVSAAGLERLRDPSGDAQWQVLRVAEEGGCDLARYNHAAAVVLCEGGGERLLLVGGNGEDHAPLDSAVELIVPST